MVLLLLSLLADSDWTFSVKCLGCSRAVVFVVNLNQISILLLILTFSLLRIKIARSLSILTANLWQFRPGSI